MNTSELVEWQRVDPINGLVQPWLTHPFLDEVIRWNLDHVTLLETGGGRSTAWWRSACKWVDTVESNEDWAAQIHVDCDSRGLSNGRLFSANIPEGTAEGRDQYFTLFPEDKQYDIVIVDGIYRNEVLQWALDHFKGRGGIIIADNWQQDYVWISEAAERLMEPYPICRFFQQDHTNHEGKPWNTVYWVV